MMMMMHIYERVNERGSTYSSSFVVCYYYMLSMSVAVTQGQTAIGHRASGQLLSTNNTQALIEQLMNVRRAEQLTD
jgi:hypothetical protein